MPYMLEDLLINRVDLVDEGANSASFIELYKRKEQNAMDVNEILSKMKPEHASVIQAALDAANEELSKSKGSLEEVTKERDTALENLSAAQEELEVEKAKSPCSCDGEADENGKCTVCGRTKPVEKAGSSFDEVETMKSMPEAARAMFEKMKLQKEAAEEEVRKAKEAEAISKAREKASELKAIPVDNDKLVDIIKKADEDVLNLLEAVNAAIEGTVLDEVGKRHVETTGKDAWAKIEAEAEEVAKRDSITKAKAISKVIKEKPELYKEYLKGGAN